MFWSPVQLLCETFLILRRTGQGMIKKCILIFTSRFFKNIQYEISWKSTQWESNCSMQRDGWMDRQHNFANVLRKIITLLHVSKKFFCQVLKIVWNLKWCIFWDLWFVYCTNFSAEWPAFEKIKESEFQLYVNLTVSLDQYESNQICTTNLLNTKCYRNMLTGVRRCRWTGMLHFVKRTDEN